MNRYDQRMQELNGEFLGATLGHEPIYVTEEEIQQVEKTLGAVLPSDYREFVRDYGNYWVDAEFPPEANSGRINLGGIGRFFGIVSERHENYGLIDIIDKYRDWYGQDEWFQECFPIAQGDGSDFYVMDFRGDSKGAIYYVVDASLQETCFIAGSFDDFMNLMIPRSYDDE